MGQILGLLAAALPLYLFGLLAGLLAKDKEPDERAIFAAMGGWVIVFFVSAWGYGNGGAMQWSAGLLYIPAAVIAFFMLRHHYRKAWVEDEA